MSKKIETIYNDIWDKIYLIKADAQYRSDEKTVKDIEVIERALIDLTTLVDEVHAECINVKSERDNVAAKLEAALEISARGISLHEPATMASLGDVADEDMEVTDEDSN